MPIADLGDVQLHYEWAGNDARPVLVLAHSLGTDLHLWDRQLAALGESYSLLRYDTRGHGRSSVPEGDYTLEDLGLDVLCLLDSLDIEEASVCGISLGGITALWLAIHASARIEAIVVANSAARIGSTQGWSDRIEQVRREGLSPLVEGTLQRWLTQPFREKNPDAVAYLNGALRATSIDGYAGCCAALRDADLTEAVSSIRIPSLVIAGLHDPVTPPSDQRFLEAKIAGSQFVDLPAAHLSNVEAAEAFNTAVIDFFAG